ncbi:MAG: rhamnogalacturonan acetylesterase [Chitinophagaceae bacterium]
MKKLIGLLLILIAAAAFINIKTKPVFYIIGDSTVRNGDGTGSNSQWGWGSFIADYFDTTKISVSNQAIGGRSSRTFITEGRWDKIMATVQQGDYVIMQFGHNDGGALDDTARARGTIKGTGDDSTEIYNPIRKMKETVHTYGWYMRKYIKGTKAKGAIAIVCSPIPRNDWKDGKVIQSMDSYSGWAQQVAKEEGTYFIDLNKIVAIKYEELGAEKVATFFPADHTHTNLEGGKLNAGIVIEAIRRIKPAKLETYLLRN